MAPCQRRRHRPSICWYTYDFGRYPTGSGKDGWRLEHRYELGYFPFSNTVKAPANSINTTDLQIDLPLKALMVPFGEVIGTNENSRQDLSGEGRDIPELNIAWARP